MLGFEHLQQQFAKVATWEEKKKTETAETRAGHHLPQEQSLSTTVVHLAAYMERRCKKTLTD